MAAPLSKLRKLQRKYKCPVFIAGDIFNRYNASAELINFALEHLPNDIWGVPGQHDLPYHRYSDIKRSAYWTLVQAGKIHHVEPNEPQWVPTWDGNIFRVHAFPWGHKIEPLKLKWQKIEDLGTDLGNGKRLNVINLALIHSYIHIGRHSYPNAPEEQNLHAMLPQLKGYDICVFGDNHKGFLWNKNKQWILNCGGFMQWKSDERSYKPLIGMIQKDGTIERIQLFSHKSGEWNDDLEKIERVETALNADEFLDSLANLGEASINFEEALRRAANREEIREPVRRIVLEMLERNNG